jgi:cbb3-type cytochrome oxidase subunit 1
MTWFVKAFVKASLAWLALGVTLGVAMAAHPTWTVYRPAHMHMTLLGFVTMMIYGVAYHVIPRFTGVPLHSARAAGWHWWMSNVGLALMVVGFFVRAGGAEAGTPILAAGGTLSALGAYTFAYVLWRTIDGPAKMRQATARVRASEGARLPVLPQRDAAATVAATVPAAAPERAAGVTRAD